MVDLATSGTFNFAPSIGECVLNAFSRIRIRGPMIKAEHLATAQQEANLLQVDWSNEGPTLWTVEEIDTLCVPGQSQYSVPAETIMLLNVTIGFGSPPAEQQLTISPLSRQEWTMIPDKLRQSRPTGYWFDRLIAAAFNLWPVPDQAYGLHYWLFRQIQDASLAGAGNFEIPYRWLDAACAGLAYRLAIHYAQDLETQRKAQYDGPDGAYTKAAKQDTEDAGIWIVPMLGGYYR